MKAVLLIVSVPLNPPAGFRSQPAGTSVFQGSQQCTRLGREPLLLEGRLTVPHYVQINGNVERGLRRADGALGAGLELAVLAFDRVLVHADDTRLGRVAGVGGAAKPVLFRQPAGGA